MGHYNNATICLNGHVVSKYQANYQKFCSKCGKETYSKCPECNSPIHGKYEVDIVNIGLHFILKNVRPYAAPCSEA